MDMAIVSAAPAQVKAAPSSNASNSASESTVAASGSGQFQEKLSTSMKGQQSTSEATAAASTSGSDATATTSTQAASTGETTTLLTAEQLIAAIGELLNALKDEDLSGLADDSDAQQQLQDLLEQLNAMLNLLGVQPVQPMPSVPGRVVEDLKEDVSQALVQLQEAIGRGQLGAAKMGVSIDWLSTQVASIQQAVQQLKSTNKAAAVDVRQETDVEAAPTANGQHNQSAADASKTAKPEPVQAKASVLLDQLNRQSVSPQLLQIIASSQSEEPSGEANAQGNEPLSIMGLSANTGSTETVRSATAIRQAQVVQVPVQQFAQAMTNMMVNKFEVNSVNGISEAKLTLTPDHLGQVDVKISVQNGQLTALFVTDTNAAKDLLDNQLAQLRANLQSQGLNVEKLEVSQQSVDSQMPQQQQGGNGQQQSNGNGRMGGEGESEEAAFEAELSQQTAIRGLGYGRAINVKA